MGKPIYDPANIRVPALLIGDGTHVVLTEKNRMQLFKEVELFFEEGRQ